jgi:SAM domain (Sterile alpha motif)
MDIDPLPQDPSDDHMVSTRFPQDPYATQADIPPDALIAKRAVDCLTDEMLGGCHPRFWTIEQVGHWLQQCGFDWAVQQFRGKCLRYRDLLFRHTVDKSMHLSMTSDNEIRGDHLVKLNENKLARIGIVALGRQEDIMVAVDALQSKVSPGTYALKRARSTKILAWKPCG